MEPKTKEKHVDKVHPHPGSSLKNIDLPAGPGTALSPWDHSSCPTHSWSYYQPHGAGRNHIMSDPNSRSTACRPNCGPGSSPMTSSNCSISEVVFSGDPGRDVLICTPSNKPANMDPEVAPITWGPGVRYTGTSNRPAHQGCDWETGSSHMAWPWPCSAVILEASLSIWLPGMSRSSPAKNNL